MRNIYGTDLRFSRLGSRRGGSISTPAGEGFATAPVLSGDFVQGQVIYSNYTVSDPLVEAVQHEWRINGTVIFGELNHTYFLFSPLTTGDTIQHRARTKNGTGWNAWVGSNILTYATPAYLTVREFGALTYAAAGGFDAPAGATSITNAGGTNLILTSGRVVPASAGVNTGQITFNNGVVVSITAIANARSVSTIDELRAAMQATGLVRGTSKILMRGGVNYNTARARKDVNLGAGGIGGTPDVGYVVIERHSNELKPNIYHIGMSALGNAGVLSEFAFHWKNILFAAPPLTDFQLTDSNTMKVSFLGRSGAADDEKWRGTKFENCYFGTPNTDAQADWRRRVSGVEDQNVHYFNRFVDCVFDRTQYGIRYPMHARVTGCLFSRFSKDAIISNVSGSVFEWCRFERAQPTSTAFNNPTVISNVAGALRIDVTGAEFMTQSVKSSREDGKWTLVSGDGDLAAHIGEHGGFVDNSTVVNGTEASIVLDFSSVNFATVTNWTLMHQAFHMDMIQSTRRDEVMFTRSPINEDPRFAGYNGVFIGLSLSHGDWPDFGAVQGIFNENQNGLDAARNFVMGCTISSVYAHAIKFADQGSSVIINNTVTAAFSPNKDCAIGLNSGDGAAGTKFPEDCLIGWNIAHGISAQDASGANSLPQISQVENYIVDQNWTNAATLFQDPHYYSGVAPFAPLSIEGFANFRVSSALAALNVGGAGSPRVMYPSRTISIPQVAYGLRVVDSGTAGTVNLSGRNLVTTDDVYWLLSSVPGNTYTAAQIKDAGNGGALPAGATAAGKKTAPTSATRWTATAAGLADGAYKLHGVADRAGSVVGATVMSSPVYVLSTSIAPVIASVDFKSAGAAATGVVIPNNAVSTLSSDIFLFEYHRGYGNMNFSTSTFNGNPITSVVSPLTLATSNRFTLSKQSNPGNITAADFSIVGGTFSSTGNAAVATISASGANTFFVGGVNPAGTVTSASNTIDVKNGDAVFVMMTTTNGDFGAINWGGLTQLAPSSLVWSGTTSYAALARIDITADNAAFPLNVSWPNGRNLVCLAHTILRKV